MKNPKVDAYIDKAAPFAASILSHLRTLIHECIPDIEENIKWSMPSFEKDGNIVISMAAYKKHCALRFFKGVSMDDPHGILMQVGNTEMRHIGNIHTMKDLPKDDILKTYIVNAFQSSYS